MANLSRRRPLQRDRGRNGENPHKQHTKNMRLPKIKELTALVKHVKKHIADDYRASEEDTAPSMQLTVATDGSGAWDYQTGDNSFTGGAYSFPHWAVVSVYRRSKSADLAREIRSQLADLMAY
jgi:hypothetical protein